MPQVTASMLGRWEISKDRTAKRKVKEFESQSETTIEFHYPIVGETHPGSSATTGSTGKNSHADARSTFSCRTWNHGSSLDEIIPDASSACMTFTSQNRFKTHFINSQQSTLWSQNP